MLLTTDEMRFFKRNGYLVKRGVLDPDLMERARARLWDGAPPGRRRDDPATWVGPFREDEENLDGANHRRGFRWNFREPGGEPWMVRLLATEPKVWAMAEQMLGEGQLVQPERIRGIYCTLPYGDHPPQALGCHTDAHPFHLGVVGYIDDVPPGGGSFMVWPESHRAFYPTFTSQYLRDQDEAVYEKVRTVFNQRTPVDTHGQTGDIVFWHHRLGHMASPTPRASCARPCSTISSRRTSSRPGRSRRKRTCGATGRTRCAPWTSDGPTGAVNRVSHTISSTRARLAGSRRR